MVGCPVGDAIDALLAGRSCLLGRFRLRGDVLSLAWLWAISRVEGVVREWLVLRACGALTATVW